jgi:hypothetical protein
MDLLDSSASENDRKWVDLTLENAKKWQARFLDDSRTSLQIAEPSDLL